MYSTVQYHVLYSIILYVSVLYQGTVLYCIIPVQIKKEHTNNTMSAARAREIETPDGMETSQAPPTLFDAVAKRDYEGMVEMYATNAKNAVASYLAMKSRWTSSVSLTKQEAKSGERKSLVL